MEVDRGRPLTDIVSGLVDLDLRREIEPVLATGESRERRVVTRDGEAHYLMRVLPYRTAERAVEGVLVTFTDITRIAEAEEYQLELRQRIDDDAADRARHRRTQPAAKARPRSRCAIGCGRWPIRIGWSRMRTGVPCRWPSWSAHELADFGIGREGRVVVDGTPVLVRANAAVKLGMALHELAARAAAEGALSVPQGRVHVDWAIEPADGRRAPAGDPLARSRRAGGARAGRARITAAP